MALVTAVLVVVGACTQGSSEQPVVEPQDPALVAAGEPLYGASCAQCHGVDLRGTDRGPSHLSSIYQPRRHTDFAFVQAVKFGSQRDAGR